MISYDQAELDAYLRDIANRMEIYRTKEKSFLKAIDMNDVLPKKPAVVEENIEIKILGMMSEIDFFPMTYKRYQDLFRSGLTYDELIHELDNDDNWID